MSGFKVVDVSNFDNESVAECLVAEGFKDHQSAQSCADMMNKDRGEGSYYWAVVKPGDYRLWRGMEDLV